MLEKYILDEFKKDQELNVPKIDEIIKMNPQEIKKVERYVNFEKLMLDNPDIVFKDQNTPFTGKEEFKINDKFFSSNIDQNYKSILLTNYAYKNAYEDLQIENRELKIKYETLSSQTSHHFSDSMKEMNNSDKIIKSLENRISKFQEEYEKLRQIAEEKKTENKALKSELDKIINEECNEYEKQINNYKAQTQQLNNEIENLKMDNQKLTKELHDKHFILYNDEPHLISNNEEIDKTIENEMYKYKSSNINNSNIIDLNIQKEIDLNQNQNHNQNIKSNSNPTKLIHEQKRDEYNELNHVENKINFDLENFNFNNHLVESLIIENPDNQFRAQNQGSIIPEEKKIFSENIIESIDNNAFSKGIRETEDDIMKLKNTNKGLINENLRLKEALRQEQNEFINLSYKIKNGEYFISNKEEEQKYVVSEKKFFDKTREAKLNLNKVLISLNSW